MSKKVFILVILIILVASVLRLWQLGNVPVSPDWDEASLGYNAYSVMNTGKDEYGESLPIIFRSFNDYKPALYAYLVIPFIKLFDLTIFAVRLPSAILGILSVVATFFLVKELFKTHELTQIRTRIDTNILALTTSFLLAISPWHIQFSRVAFEAQMGLAFNILSILFFIKGLKKPIFLLFSVLFASLSIYSYQSEKVYLPILFLTLFFIYKKELWLTPKKWLFSSIILGFMLLLPFLYSTLFSQDIFSRAKGVSAFSSYKTESIKRNSLNYTKDKERRDYLGIVLDNKRVEYVKVMFSGYISHFDLNWLFIKGDIERHHAPNMGLLYLFELPFLLIGIYKLIFNNFSRKTKLAVFSIFLITPIPASITIDVPHAVRTINFLPVLQIFTAIGLVHSFIFINDNLPKRQSIALLKKLSYLFFTFVVLFNITYYLDQYFVQQNFYYSKYWQYGYKEAIQEVEKIKSSYSKIVVSDKTPMDQSYIFFLFYLKYNPSEYQNQANNVSKKFDKYEFRNIDWEKDSKDSNILYIGSNEDFPQEIKSLKTIYNLDNTPAIKIVGT